MLVGSVFFCMCGGLWKDCGTGRASFCHAYLLFVCDPPFVRSATCSSSLQDNGLNFCHQISFAGTHISATKVHLPPTTYNRLLSAVDPSPTIVLGFQKGVGKRQKSSQNSKCNYWETAALSLRWHCHSATTQKLAKKKQK